MTIRNRLISWVQFFTALPTGSTCSEGFASRTNTNVSFHVGGPVLWAKLA
jgi:hypothetical protein